MILAAHSLAWTDVEAGARRDELGNVSRIIIIIIMETAIVFVLRHVPPSARPIDAYLRLHSWG
jgi:hypothetical protein